MAKKINKTEEIISRLGAEKKITIMNKAEDVSFISALDKRMNNLRRDYQIKDKNSQYSAARVILTS